MRRRRWVADGLMPAIHRKLGRDDSGATSISLLEDFEQVVARARVERLQAPVVEDQQIGSAKGFQHAGMAAVAARQGEVFAELGPAVIEHGAIVAAGLVADGAGEPAFTNAAGADEGQMSWASIQALSVSFWKRARSRPRGLR